MVPKSLNTTPLSILSLLIFLLIGCSSDNSDSNGLNAIITSESSIALFDTISLDASSSEGDIQEYEWTLISVPASVDTATQEKYAAEINSQDDNTIGFFPRHAGTYEVQLTITDGNNKQSTDQYTFEVSEICNNSFNYTNLLTHTFDSAADWETSEGPDNILDDCSGQSEHEFGFVDIGSEGLEIFSGTDKQFRLVKNNLSEIDLMPDNKYRLNISIEGRMNKPYLHEFFRKEIYRTNFILRYGNQELRIKVQDEFDWLDDEFLPIPENYYFQNELTVYFAVIDNEQILFACSEGVDYTADLEMVETSSEETSMSFVAHAQFAETDCWRSNTLKITEFSIDEFD